MIVRDVGWIPAFTGEAKEKSRTDNRIMTGMTYKRAGRCAVCKL